MMGCHMSYQTLRRPVFYSHSRRQIALNSPRQANPKLNGGLRGVFVCVGGHSEVTWCCLWISPRKPCHRSFIEPVLYTLRRKGRGLAEASPQQQKTAYGKCPSYLAKTVMSSEWNMHFHTLYPVLRVCLLQCICLYVCVCVCFSGDRWNEHTSTWLLHAASPSGRPQLYRKDVASWMIPSCILNELHNKLMFMGDLSCAGVIMSIYWLIKQWLRVICSTDD